MIKHRIRTKPIRIDKGRDKRPELVQGTIEVNLVRGTAIKAFCTECLGWGEANPKDCTDRNCPLFPFRGKTQLVYQQPTEGLKNAPSPFQNTLESMPAQNVTKGPSGPEGRV